MGNQRTTVLETGREKKEKKKKVLLECGIRRAHCVWKFLVIKDASIAKDMKISFNREGSDLGRRHCGLLGTESTVR